MNEITIDAKGLPIGRVASQVANILNGKTDTDYTPNTVSKKKVRVINIAKVAITGDKLGKKVYYSHSGYPGALRGVSMREIFEKDPCKLFNRILSGMISSNRLKDDKLSNVRLEA